jgi:hypothetical protein
MPEDASKKFPLGDNIALEQFREEKNNHFLFQIWFLVSLILNGRELDCDNLLILRKNVCFKFGQQKFLIR